MNMHAHPQDDEDAHSPLMQSLDQQLRLLKKELKTKDDKITRLTEHAVMMGHHMDKLKGEVKINSQCVHYFTTYFWFFLRRSKP